MRFTVTVSGLDEKGLGDLFVITDRAGLAERALIHWRSRPDNGDSPYLMTLPDLSPPELADLAESVTIENGTR